MRTTLRRSGGLAVSIVAVLLTASAAERLTAQDTTKGKVVYGKWCAECHGVEGDGKGAAQRYMLPYPRDFTGAIYKVRSTATGNLPTDADLMHAIDEGLPGTAMPDWKDRLTKDERRDVMAYIKTFSAFFADTSQHPQVLTYASEPGGGTGAEALKVGRQFYDSILCRKCHGDQGRGDGPSAPTLKDDAGQPIFAANLQASWLFRGGLERPRRVPPDADRARRHADAVVLRSPRPEVPYGRTVVAGGPIRPQSLAREGA